MIENIIFMRKCYKNITTSPTIDEISVKRLIPANKNTNASSVKKPIQSPNP